MTSIVSFSCPLCSKTLSKNGSLLECPSGDYRAPAGILVSRWERFDKERGETALISDRGLELAGALLDDLKRMNIPRIKPL